MNQEIRKKIQKAGLKNSSEAEYREMLELFHDPMSEYQLKDALMEELSISEVQDTASLPDFRKMFRSVWMEIEKSGSKEKSSWFILFPWTRVAAALLLGLLLGLFVNTLINRRSEPLYYFAHSPKGSISEMVLPDSTVIFLNADSRIRYTVDGEDGCREVFLYGEAWFDVTKSKKKPLIVHTPYYDVVVTGTQFNIKAYETDRDIVTTLEEGSVFLRSTGIYRFGEDIVLEPGEQAVLDKESKEVAIRKVDARLFTSWKDNKLTFINMNMKEFIVLLERKYGVDIEVTNKEILKLHFDGTIKNESIIEILEVIKKTLPLSYHIVGQKIEITKSNH